MSIEGDLSTPNENDNSHISQSFRDQKQIDAFIRRNKLLKIIEGATEQFIKKYRQFKRPEDALGALLVPLHFEYVDFIQNTHIELLHLIVEEPQQFLNAAKYCVYALVRDLIKQSGSTEANGGGALKSIDIDQVHLQVRFIGLPAQENLHFAHFKNCWLPGLSWTTGILSAISETRSAILQSVWFCSTGCNRNKIKSESTDAPTCNSCARLMNEYSKLRVTENYHVLRLLPPNCIETPIIVNKVFRALTVHARGKISQREKHTSTMVIYDLVINTLS